MYHRLYLPALTRGGPMPVLIPLAGRIKEKMARQTTKSYILAVLRGVLRGKAQLVFSMHPESILLTKSSIKAQTCRFSQISRRAPNPDPASCSFESCGCSRRCDAFLPGLRHQAASGFNASQAPVSN